MEVAAAGVKSWDRQTRWAEMKLRQGVPRKFTLLKRTCMN
jgi:hypothetical protein